LPPPLSLATQKNEKKKKKFLQGSSQRQKAFIELSLQNIIFRHLVARMKSFFVRSSSNKEL
jgi:hypothetical protein